jgi:NodT family efflux transporter outer membrane factor (OMF) lipoprotein
MTEMLKALANSTAHFAVLGFAAMLCACAVGPNYRPPQMELPAAFAASQAAAVKPAKAEPAASGAATDVDPEAWWRSLGDPDLDALVARAIRSNPDIEIALYRLQEARTQEVVVLGGALPQADLSAGGGFGTGSNLGRGRVGSPLNAATNSSGIQNVHWVAGLDASWELDLFGKYRREIEASRYDTQAAADARNAVLIAVVADVVRTYLDMRGLQMELAVIDQAVDTAQQTVGLMRTRFQGGFTNELDLALAQREFGTLRARVAPIVARVSAAQNAIAVLLGQYPEKMARELQSSRAIPSIPPQVGAGLPLDLLRRRPDIREAERQLAAATARIGVATADLFPHVGLTGGVGVQVPALVSSGRGGPIWSVGPLGQWSFLDFGALDAVVDIADLRTREQLVAYRATVIRAVGEVDTAVTAYMAQRERLDALGDALTASHRAVTLATDRYERGLNDFLNVLDAQRQEYDLEDQYVGAQSATGDAFVALYKALGGGWESHQSIPPIRRPRPAVVAAFARLFSRSEDPQK